MGMEAQMGELGEGRIELLGAEAVWFLLPFLAVEIGDVSVEGIRVGPVLEFIQGAVAEFRFP